MESRLKTLKTFPGVFSNSVAVEPLRLHQDTEVSLASPEAIPEVLGRAELAGAHSTHCWVLLAQ